jgi:hypothetical protein
MINKRRIPKSEEIKGNEAELMAFYRDPMRKRLVNFLKQTFGMYF